MAWLNSWMMFWWKLLGRASAELLEAVDEQAERMADNLAEEIRLAHREWLNAQHRFEVALGKDQVDYAIFAIEAAEKRYEMLLRSAKTLPVSWHGERRANVG